MRSTCLVAISIGASSVLTLASCGGSQTDVGEKPMAGPADPPFDPCQDSEPLQKTYRGLLKNARCDQDVYFRMARIAGQLGVECSYCHAPKDGSPGGKETDYPKMTEMKQRALFMGHEFLDGLVRKDKKPIECSHCHVDKAGKPAPKFLGTPRDKVWTLDWMNLRMVNDFTTKDGQKLKCKHCHVAAYGMPGFEPKVILAEANPRIPGVPPFVRFEEGEGAPVPSGSASASAGAPAVSVAPSAAPPSAAPPSAAPPSAAPPSAATPPALVPSAGASTRPTPPSPPPSAAPEPKRP